MVILQALLNCQSGSGDTAVSLDLSLSVEACLMAAAALIETSRQHGIENCVRQASTNLRTYIGSFREHHITGGMNAMEQLGAINVGLTSAH